MDGAGPISALFGVERSLSGRRWTLRPADDRIAGEIARLAGCADPLARMLAGRGVAPEAAASFLRPRLRDWFPDPSRFTGMDEAARLIWDHVDAGRRIAVFADYDVDGATSAAQLLLWLRALGLEGLVYVPDRIEEGYGPNVPAFERLKAEGAELVITVDCGAAATGPLEAAARLGLQVVVVDHHMMDGAPPPAAALVNPNQPGDGSECGHLAAAGVVFVLLAALNREGRRRGRFKTGPEPDLLRFAGLAALGTICDVVPLTGFNRALVAQGLKVISARADAGLAALAEAAGAEGPATPYQAGFLLGPRINAGGRVGRADLGVRLLTSQDPAEQAAIAAELDRLNAERRRIEAEVLAAATAQAEAQAADPDAPVLVAEGEGWHAGVIGIAAGRLKERFNRPAVVIGVDPATGLGKGSGRSVPGVDLGAAVVAARAEGLLEAGGGHPMAAGLTVRADRIAPLRAFLAERMQADWRAADEARALTLDGVLSAGAVDYALHEALAAGGPYGAGHAEPRFGFADLRLAFAKRVGADHVRASFEGRDGRRLNAIAFRVADTPVGEALLSGAEGPWHAAGRVKGSDDRFGRRAELQLEDLAKAP